MIIKFKKRFLVIFIFLFNISNICSQIVSNVIVSQEEQKVLVKYILSTEQPCKIELFVSKDDGTNWTGPLKKVVGDVGEKISSGNKVIYWDVLEEQETLQGEKIRFKLVASNYKGVQIGTQYWMTENLNVDKFRNGDPIPQAQTDEEWEKAGNNKQPAWCYYNNDSTNYKKYGKLYNWYAVNDPRGLAPEGWHIPSIDEVIILMDYLGGYEVAGKKMKSKDGWFDNGNGTNEIGFNGIPNPSRYYDGTFSSLDKFGDWWYNIEFNHSDFVKGYEYNIELSYKLDVLNFVLKAIGDGHCVRCIRN